MQLQACLPLQVAEHAEEIRGLRIAARSEHADQAIGLRAVASPSFSKPIVAVWSSGSRTAMQQNYKIISHFTRSFA
jgi:hypothetical protein